MQYEPELFPGLIYRMKEPKVVLLIFVSGKVVLTGQRFMTLHAHFPELLLKSFLCRRLASFDVVEAYLLHLRASHTCHCSGPCAAEMMCIGRQLTKCWMCRGQEARGPVPGL